MSCSTRRRAASGNESFFRDFCDSVHARFAYLYVEMCILARFNFGDEKWFCVGWCLGNIIISNIEVAAYK